MNKVVKLKSLRLLNFKGIKELTVDFGEVTEITGANATGKSTIFDAFTWCLFGKDANGKTDFELKTKQNGVVIPKIEHEVTAVLEVNGEEVSLTRTLNEDWVKPRGKAEPELKGNITHYLVNGVEIKAGAFQERVASIVEEQLFKLITNPSYFPSLDWKKQRPLQGTKPGLLLPQLISGLKTKQGRRSAVTNKYIVSRLKGSFKISAARVRKIINHIRTNDLIPGLIATSKGYFIAETEEELRGYEKSLLGRELAIRQVRESIARQRRILYEQKRGEQRSSFNQ